MADDHRLADSQWPVHYQALPQMHAEKRGLLLKDTRSRLFARSSTRRSSSSFAHHSSLADLYIICGRYINCLPCG
jgi:hypothetical protein